jgi:hypothetical protein
MLHSPSLQFGAHCSHRTCARHSSEPVTAESASTVVPLDVYSTPPGPSTGSTRVPGQLVPTAHMTASWGPGGVARGDRPLRWESCPAWAQGMLAPGLGLGLGLGVNEAEGLGEGLASGETDVRKRPGEGWREGRQQK